MTWSARVLVPKPQLAYECFSELFCALTALGEWYMPGPGTCSKQSHSECRGTCQPLQGLALGDLGVVQWQAAELVAGPWVRDWAEGPWVMGSGYRGL